MLSRLVASCREEYALSPAAGIIATQCGAVEMWRVVVLERPGGHTWRLGAPQTAQATTGLQLTQKLSRLRADYRAEYALSPAAGIITNKGEGGGLGGRPSRRPAGYAGVTDVTEHLFFIT